MSILYAYYKIWFNFDINTLHKDAKKDAKIISEHSNSSTIFKSGVLKSGVGAAISMARLELYQHSYFMNLYENAYENYVEKIAEIESYKANKHLRDSSTTNDSEAAEAEAAKAEAELKNINKEFEEKVDNVNIAKSERRKVEKKLLDFDSENDRTLKDNNMELYKNALGKSKLNSEKIEDISEKQKNILNTKKDLQQQVRELKTSENKARDAIGTIGTIGSLNPFAKKDVLDSIVPGKDKVGKVGKFGKVFEKINKEGLMNMGVDKAKGMFDNIKIDPQALLKA
jgi:DNA repair exonuclease SbcCD ATPase subunit